MEKPARFATPPSRPLDATHRIGCAASHSLEVAPRPQRTSSAMPRRCSRLYPGEKPGEHTTSGGVNPFVHLLVCRLGKYHHFHRRLCNDFDKRKLLPI